MFNISDDIMAHAATQNKHLQQLRKVFDKIREKRLKLNLKICEFGKSSINYMGHVLSSEGLFPESEKVNSILHMKPPSNTVEVRSFLGLVTYCSKFVPNFAAITKPLRQLTCQKADFIWNGKQESAFSKIKTFISKAPVLSYFHPVFETKIVADASKQGLGAVVRQKNPANSFCQPVAFASRSLSEAETRCSQTEREALAVVFSCERVKNYLYGLRFTVVTDHKPLPKLYSPFCSEPPTRIHRWSLRHFKLEYELGLNNIADILSGKPFFDTPTVNEAEHFVNYVVSNSMPKTLTFHEIREATQNNHILGKVCDAINNNRWRFYENDIHVKPYYVLRKELVFHDGVILRKQKLVIPHCLRPPFSD